MRAAVARVGVEQLRSIAADTAYKKPARTGYNDERDVYHPSPSDTRNFDDHADGCVKCDAERLDPERSGYVNRRGPRTSEGVYR